MSAEQLLIVSPLPRASAALAGVRPAGCEPGNSCSITSHQASAPFLVLNRRLDVSVRYRRMPDYQLSGLLGSTFPYQPKPQAQAQ